MNISQLLETMSGLMGTKRFHTMNWRQFTSTLEQTYGIRVLGLGSFATVFWHPSWNFVYKIYEEDSGFAQYVEYCMENNDNPHLLRVLRPPRKVHAFHLRKKETSTTLWAVKLELLTDLTKPAMQVVNSGRLWNAVQDYVDDAEQFDYNNISSGRDDLNQIFTQYDMIGLVKTLADLSDYVGIHPEDFDLHHRNLMMRGETIVILDPLMGSEHDSPANFRVNVEVGHKNAIMGPSRTTNPEKIFD